MPIFKVKKWRLTELNTFVATDLGENPQLHALPTEGCGIHLSALVWSLEGEIPVHQLKRI